jgi:hypothetical protein
MGGCRFDSALQLPWELTANDRDIIYDRSFILSSGKVVDRVSVDAFFGTIDW